MLENEDTPKTAPEGQIEEVLDLETKIRLFETPFSEVCEILGVELAGPKNVIEVEDSVFMFDPEQDYLFSGAVILDNQYGFFGIRIGANWLKTAENLESMGFVQAEDLDRFTKIGGEFNTSVYLYPDSDTDDSRVQHYSLCVGYGSKP
jgi:hypothetical protein